ncbi:ADP-ribosylglycohydrolase family protein [Alkaliphilus metalliredigens]|uniref:ADP-ribosylglycohydrolase family protein n=1 Tax=Alkaliphilus metalliredigens TaxID=208226 RepID=UPI0009FBD302|nr:ADP-ribosylglycohydrolase family protein [Alkaliphilus metalliredigens]
MKWKKYLKEKPRQNVINDFKKAVITAVNKNRDRDSTGAITGNILGAYLRITEITQEWIEKVEMKDENNQ